jgi:cytochrome c553
MKRVLLFVTAAFVLLVALRMSAQPAPATTTDGQQVFRFDTFGDEQLWTDTLQMQQAVATVSPATALKVGLKVDADALPASVVDAIRAGQVDLNDPAVTIELLKLNAVVGVVGQVSETGHLDSVGVTCGLCHSTVDNSFAPGIGRRLDGWPNRDLNVGAIIALSPVLTSDQKALFNSWGPGRYDPRLHAFDGTSFIALNSPTLPVLIPPAYGLKGVGFETVTGDGPVSFWNSYVAVTQMGGHGSFSDPRIGLSITQTPDVVTPKLPALVDYELSLHAPEPPRGSFNRAAAQRGETVFSGAAKCSTCHTPPTFTDVLRGPDPTQPLLHTPSETGLEPVYAARSATGAYRTAPLRGIWQHAPYFHDGSAADLPAVVDHYNSVLSLGLSAAQKADLVEYLKSL